MTNIPIPPPTEPLTDNQTGGVKDVWYRYFTSGSIGLNALSGSTLQSLNTLSVQVIAADTTYTPTANTKHVIVIATGGGGGGGGAKSGGSSVVRPAGSGAGGGTAIAFWSTAELGASAVVSIGTAGTAGTTSGTAGAVGGNTIVDPIGSATSLVCVGGSGGSTGDGAVAIGTSGGSASNGDINLSGGGSDPGMGDAASTRGISGSGGASYWGGGAYGVAASTPGVVTGKPGVVYGSGGGGGLSVLSSAGVAGGDGAPGIAMFIEFIAST